MIKRALVAAAAALALSCNSGPSQTADNSVGGADVVSNAQVPMASAVMSLSLDWGKKARAGQTAIVDLLTYSGPKTKITAPPGWQLIRDDATNTTRESLFWHTVEAGDTSVSSWTFNVPVDAQGAIVLLDNAAASPIDIASGNTGSGGVLTAKSVATSADGNLILSFFATDFSGPGLRPTIPTDVSLLIDQEKASHEYWILASYQDQRGNTDDVVSSTGQLFNWVAAQIAIKRGSATPSGT